MMVETVGTNIYVNTWNGTAGLWNRVDSDTVDEELERENPVTDQPAVTKMPGPLVGRK